MIAGIAAAQTKIVGDGKCPKPVKEETMDVGDRTGLERAVPAYFGLTTPTELAEAIHTGRIEQRFRCRGLACARVVVD